MKKNFLSNYLLSIFSLIILCFIISMPVETNAQSPYPPSGGEDSGEPITPGTPSTESVTEESASNIDSPSSVDAFTCTSPPDNWLLKAPLPTATYGVGTTSDGKYVYAAGGYGLTPLNIFYRYDPSTDQWVTLPSLPTAVYNALTIYAQGKIFVIGGYNGAAALSLVQIYSISTNSWSSGASMPDIRQQMGGGYYNGKIYAVGGYQSGAIGSASNQTWEYTISSNSWAFKANLPNLLAGPASGVVNGNLYIIGGRDNTGAHLNSTYIYSFTTNSWSSGAPIPTAVNYPGSVVYNSRIWVLGGGTPFLTSEALSPDNPQAVNITQVYDPFTNTWQNGPMMNMARSFVGSAAVGNRIIAVGGYGAGSTDAVEVLNQNLMKVLIIYADANTYPAGLRQSIVTQAGVGQVDAYNGATGTPSLSQLMFYDVVVAYSNSLFSNSTILGDNLALYQDNGGVVVPMVFSFTDSYNISGDWWAVGYSPFNLGTNRFVAATLGSFVSGHPLMIGVDTLNAYFRSTTTLAPGAAQVATWSDGQPLIASKGRAVGINAYPGDYSKQWNGDFGRVIVNAGNWLWLGNRSCSSLSCSPVKTIQGSISAADLTQTGRLLRDNPPTTCDAATACSVTGADILNFDQYQFLNNTSIEQCVTVTIDTGACADYSLHSSAYLGSYNPSSLCTNYLADIGASPNQFGSYSFRVPAWQAYTVIVNEVDIEPVCSDYTLTVSASDCMMNTFLTPLILKSTP